MMLTHSIPPWRLMSGTTWKSSPAQVGSSFKLNHCESHNQNQSLSLAYISLFLLHLLQSRDAPFLFGISRLDPEQTKPS